MRSSMPMRKKEMARLTGTISQCAPANSSYRQTGSASSHLRVRFQKQESAERGDDKKEKTPKTRRRQEKTQSKHCKHT